MGKGFQFTFYFLYGFAPKVNFNSVNFVAAIKCQTPSKRRTNGLGSFVRLSLSVVSVGRPSYGGGERTAMLHRNLRGGIKSGINQ